MAVDYDWQVEFVKNLLLDGEPVDTIKAPKTVIKKARKALGLRDVRQVRKMQNKIMQDRNDALEAQRLEEERIIEAKKQRRRELEQARNNKVYDLRQQRRKEGIKKSGFSLLEGETEQERERRLEYVKEAVACYKNKHIRVKKYTQLNKKLTMIHANKMIRTNPDYAKRYHEWVKFTNPSVSERDSGPISAETRKARAEYRRRYHRLPKTRKRKYVRKKLAKRLAENPFIDKTEKELLITIWEYEFDQIIAEERRNGGWRQGLSAKAIHMQNMWINRIIRSRRENRRRWARENRELARQRGKEALERHMEKRISKHKGKGHIRRKICARRREFGNMGVIRFNKVYPRFIGMKVRTGAIQDPRKYGYKLHNHSRVAKMVGARRGLYSFKHNWGWFGSNWNK